MKTFGKYLFFCTLIIILFIKNVASKSSFYDDTIIQTENFKQDVSSIVDYRLPRSIKPISYNVKLIPKLKDDFKFKGYATITALVKRTTNHVTLHAENIEIESVFIHSYRNKRFSYKYDMTNKYTIISPKPFRKGNLIKINIKYNGILADDMLGFYRSSYFDENGQIKWLAATQFQTIYARRAFPCFDEPGFKAKFKFYIARDKNYHCLSNMPLIKSKRRGGKIWDVFEETIPMSTYTVGFVISEFQSLQKDNFTVWSKPSTLYQAKYALDFGSAVLEVLNNIFQLPYHLPKLDMVALPDFVTGAMENWGLVTYRESVMLYDEKESSVLSQQKVATLIAHELAHMWFGNLVTPEWWSCLWLSEAFATYFEYFATAEIEQSWNITEQFLMYKHQPGLMVDGIESSPPMTRDVSTDAQVKGAGDQITYAKGGSIVRMMSLVFGVDNFRAALQNYLKKNKREGLGNPDALWKEIQKQVDVEHSTSNISVKSIMDSWTIQSGYPVVSVKINDDGVVNLSQERFLLRNLDKTSTDVTWYVPLTFATQSNPDFSNTVPKYWINTKEATAEFKINPEEWATFNLQSSAFYRVNYDDRGWQRIFDFLKSDKFEEIHVLNRAAIVDDLLNLGRAGYQNNVAVLDRLLYLKRETNYLPFKAALNGLEYFNKRFTGFAEHDLFKMYVLSLIENIRAKLGYEDHENDDRFTVLLRREINNWACNFDDNECVTTYTKKFNQWKSNPSDRIKPNERTAAYCTAIRHGTSEDWKFLWDEYINSNLASDQTVILGALGCSQNTTILEKYLRYAITDFETNRIRKMDSTIVFSAVSNSGLLGAEYVLDFVDKHYKEMGKYFRDQTTISSILNAVSQRLSTPQSINKYEEFINNHKQDFVSIEKSLTSSLRVAKYELEWFKSNSPSMIQWLQKYDKTAY